MDETCKMTTKPVKCIPYCTKQGLQFLIFFIFYLLIFCLWWVWDYIYRLIQEELFHLLQIMILFYKPYKYRKFKSLYINYRQTQWLNSQDKYKNNAGYSVQADTQYTCTFLSFRFHFQDIFYLKSYDTGFLTTWFNLHCLLSNYRIPYIFMWWM